MSYSIKRDPVLDVKYSFLRFLQAKFKAATDYTWAYDVRTSKIFILDKYAFDIGVTLKRPAIILNRNDMAWTYVNGDQNGTNSISNSEFTKLYGDAPNANPINSRVYTDLLVGRLVFTVLSKNGIEAERIASRIFSYFTAYKDELRSDGIHKVTNLSISSENVVKQNADLELVAVNVNLTYYKQQTVRKGETYHDLTIYMDGVVLDQSLDYNVELNGQYIVFLRDIPDGSIITVDFIDAITLETIDSAGLIATADPLRFKISDNRTIQGFYVPLGDIELDITTNTYE